MTIEATSWAYRQWLDPMTKLVLVAIANYADHETGEGWPSLNAMIGLTCMSRRTVQRHIATLVDKGLLVKSERYTDRGRQTSNLYRIDTSVTIGRTPSAAVEADEFEGDSEGEGVTLTPWGGCHSDTLEGVTCDTGEGVTGDTLTTLNRQKELLQEPIPPQSPKGAREARAQATRSEVRSDRSASDRSSGDPGDTGFDAFFAAWLAADERHQVDRRGPALAAWRRLTGPERTAAVLPEKIRAVVLGQRRSGRQKLLSASTYLREKLWTQVAAGPTAASSKMVLLAAWSRAWWVRWHSVAFGAGGGAKVAFMVKQARSGMPFGVPLAEAQRFEAEAAGYAYVLVGSPEFGAWGKWAAARGVTLPRPDRADRIFLPSILPPEDGS